jgi:gamma-glutamylcyclotransferase (GGCT)/AIG2-like uncharacterized protein YtfP
MRASVDLFVYGTLMNEDLLYSLTRCRFSRSEAELAGFARLSQPNGYPYIVPRQDATVCGLLLHNIDTASLAILDDYEEEGVLYQRRSVVVTVGERRLPCEVYVGNVATLTRRLPPPDSFPALLNF